MSFEYQTIGFQHTAARRRLGIGVFGIIQSSCFNTQPPEGGWRPRRSSSIKSTRFNTQPPEGGWRWKTAQPQSQRQFQHTAARRRLVPIEVTAIDTFCFNTQPPEGGWLKPFGVTAKITVSTHSRPKAAGDRHRRERNGKPRFNTQPPEGGWKNFCISHI